MILTIVDQKYIPEAETLIRSCAKHDPEERFLVCLVNSDPQGDNAIRRWHPRMEIDHLTVPYKKEDWGGIMCGLRGKPILKALERWKEPTLYLDSDILLRRSVQPLMRELRSFDLMVKPREHLEIVGPMGTPHAAKFNAGVIGIGPTETGIAFAREYERRLREWYDSGRNFHLFQTSHNVITGVDQELLYVMYLEWRDRLNFKPLENKYNDSLLYRDSVIWHGKGKARRQPAYRLEQLYYTRRWLWYVLTPVYRTLRFLLWPWVRPKSTSSLPSPVAGNGS